MWVQKWKKYHMCKKCYIWNLSTCTYENGKYLRCAIDDSVITCDEIITQQKTLQQKAPQQKLFQQRILQQLSIF